MKKNIILILNAFIILLFSGCSIKHEQKEHLPDLQAGNFKKTIDGKQTNLYFLNNGTVKMAITNYGARIVSLCIPDRDGKYADVVLGFKSIDDYLNAKGPYHGAIIGRVSNRIANGKFTMDSVEYTLPINNKTNHLHGGAQGFHSKVWDVKAVNDSSIVLAYRSKDGEMGYPGNLDVEVTYKLSPENELMISYEATTDKKNPVMLTNHAFWNLAGEGSGTINDHVLTINADSCIQVDSTLIPTGEIIAVEGSILDFRTPKRVGHDLDILQKMDPQGNRQGYDNNWPINKKTAGEMTYAGSVLEPVSGRKMDVYTEEPVLLFYGGNFIKNRDTGKYNKLFKYQEAFCLETQHYPDSPNHSNFPSIFLEKGEEYRTLTSYKFSTE